MDSNFSRRTLIRSIASAAALGALGSAAGMSRQAKAATGDRKFMFFFAGGGWDATPLDPKFGMDGVSPVGGTDMDPDTFLGKAGNLTWSSGDDRRGMDVFFQKWGKRTALIRGVDVHSAGHESGMQWMMTGTSASQRSDWPTIIASNGKVEYPMPHLVFAGPAYPGQLGAAVVRGGGGSLLDLIDGSMNGRVDRPAPVVPTPMDSMMDRFVRDRTARWMSARNGDFAASRGADLLDNVERGMELEGRRFEAGLSNENRTLLDQAVMAAEVMRLGLCRCAMLGIPGGWDTHGGNQNVGPQLDTFFMMLDELFTHLASTPGNSAPWLADEITIVLCSELGRTPKFNGSMGRDHWPYTSMLIAGSGIRGNRVHGMTDEGFISMPIDLTTGQPDANGIVLGTEHVGTALLNLAEVDSEQWLPGVESLTALSGDMG